MASNISFANGLTVHSQSFLPSSSLIQGGDIFNFTVDLIYGGSQSNFSLNSSACNNTSPIVKGLIVLPLVFYLASSTRVSQRVTSNVSHCLIAPVLNVSAITNLSNTRSQIQVNASDVGWTTKLYFTVQVTERVLPDSQLNVTANFMVGAETKTILVAHYMTYSIEDLSIMPQTTSYIQTPSLQLTTEEELEFNVSVMIPSITTDMNLLITLPAFGGLTPMSFVYANVQKIPSGITSGNLKIGSTSQFSTGETYRSSFPSIKNVANFNFGKTVSTLPLVHTNSTVGGSGMSIVLIVRVRVDSSSGTYVTNGKGNITSELIYQTLRDPKHLGPVYLSLDLGEPLLEHTFTLVNPLQYYEGKDVLPFEFKVVNPMTATREASNVSFGIKIPEDMAEIQNSSVHLCNSFTCTQIGVNNWNGSNLTVSRLNTSNEIRGRFVMTIKPTVEAGSQVISIFSLSYKRLQWSAIQRSMAKTAFIKKVTYSGPHSITSSVQSPNDQSVIIAGEEVTFDFKMMVPISRSRNFILVIRGDGIAVLRGVVKQAGPSIVTASGTQLQGLELNVTSDAIPGTTLNNITSPAATGSFGTLSNTGNSTAPDAGHINFQATVRAANASGLAGLRDVSINLEAFIKDNPAPQQYTFKLRIVQPELQVLARATPHEEVKSNQHVDFALNLTHTPRSTAHAYRVLLEVAVPHKYLILDTGSVRPVNSVRVVNGDQAPSRSPRYNDRQTKVLVYETDAFNLDTRTPSHVTLRFRARTTSSIPSSRFIRLPTYLRYTILPRHLAPRTGGVFTIEAEQAEFLTTRPDSYVQVLYTSDLLTLDAGDRVEYNITVTNIGSKGDTYTAYELKLTFNFGRLDMTRTTLACDRGTVTVNSSASSAVAVIGDLLDTQTFFCNITAFAPDRVYPKENINPVINYRYYSKAANTRPIGFAAYELTASTQLLITTVNATMTGSSNVGTLLAGQTFGFALRLGIPECVTPLKITVKMPVVDVNGTRFARRRRRAVEFGDVAVFHRSNRVRRSSSLVYVLEPLLNESSVTLDANSSLVMTHPSPNISRLDSTTLEIDFGTIQSQASLGPSTQGISVYLRFRSANRPLALSGRSLQLVVNIGFTGGSETANGLFKIVGPLFKPLLTIFKSVKGVDYDRDSPLLLYNVTVTHSPGSSYDAYDVTVSDTTESMKLDRSSVMPKSNVLVTYPVVNTHVIRLTIPKLAVGESASLVYKASFLVKEKDRKSVNLPATVAWKSIQLNSPTYKLKSNLTACATRIDTSRWKTREITGYFALGILLGFLIGLVVAGVVILLIIKCCDKGKIAPLYARFTNKKSMIVLTGGSQYIYQAVGGGGPEYKLVARHNEASIVQTDESIIPILSLDSAIQTEKELDSLDVQATVAMDADLDVQRQNMFLQVLSLLAKKLRVKREISSEQEKNFVSSLRSEIGGIAHKLSAEFKRRSAEIRRRLKKAYKVKMEELAKRQAKEISETENKIKRLVSNRERRDILDMLRKRHISEEKELKNMSKLDEDVEMEKLRKELAVSKRFAMKETQSKLLQDLTKEANFNEEQASALVRDHVANMAAVDKAMDEEKSRRIVALEMRIAERRALARQKHDEEEHNKGVLQSVDARHVETMEELVRSSKLSEAEADAYRERYRKEVEALEKKLQKERQKQEDSLHKRLTALKQKRLEDKVRDHKEQLRKLDEEENDKFEEVEIDCIANVEERQKLLQRQREEQEELEKDADKEAAQELERIHEVQAREIQEQAKTSLKKIYQDIAAKGLAEAEKNAIVDRHLAELSRQLEEREEEKQRNSEMLQKRLVKLRKSLEKKAQEENEEQAELRKKEEQIVSDLIVNQVVMSEEERERIMEEHEKNLAELETSLTFNKLRQRQKLEQKLAEKRKHKMDELQRKQQEEEQGRESADKILDEDEDVELLKKHEQEKLTLLSQDNDTRFDDEIDQVREDMINERAKKLEEHQENLSATIARLQIEKAKQISQMAMQQQLLGQLQTDLVDELESQGAFDDPETEKIVEKYKKDTKKLEENLRNQRLKQGEALRERLQKKMQQREESLLVDQKVKFSRYMDDGVNKATLRFRKAAVKARHNKEMDELKGRIEREIEQSLNELKLGQELQRMKAVEQQNLKLISALVTKGKLKQEEMESVLKFLFPNKTSEYVDDLMAKIFGPSHVKTSETFETGDIGNLEMRVRRSSLKPIAFISSKKSKKRKKKSRTRDEEHALPPVVVRGGRKASRQDPSVSHLEDNEQRHIYSSWKETDGPEYGSQGSLPISGHSQHSFSPGVESPEDQRLLDEMFGETSEGEVRRSGKKKKQKRQRDR